MKIAFFSDTYYPQINGVTISIDNFAKEFRKKGHTVYIFAPKINEYHDTDPHVIRLSSVKILSSEPEVRVPFFFPHKIVSQILPIQFDIVHAHGNGAFSLLGYQIARMKRVPYVLTFHTQHTKYTHYVLNGKIITPRMVSAGLRIFANMCDVVVTPSEKMKDELQKYGVKKPIQVIPNFVDVSHFKHVKKGYLHKTCNIPSDAPILLTVGRLGKEKNFVFLMKMFKKLTKKDKKTHLVIVGHGVEEEHLRSLRKNLNLEERIHFTGKIENELMPRVYADADIFVFASKTEVHPLVVLEAAASGLPFVIVNDKAFLHIVEDKTNGFLLPLDQQLFVGKITLLLKDENLREAFGKASREMIAKHNNKKSIVNDLYALYAQTIAANGHTRTTLQSINKVARLQIQRTAHVLERLFT